MSEEMTNQSIPETTTEETYEWDDAEPTSETSDNSAESETSNSEAEPKTDGDAETANVNENKDESTSSDPFLTIKYNGADENLSREEAVSLAQKGRNYDKVLERYNALQNDPSLKTITEQAQRAGLSVNDYVQRISQYQQQTDIRTIAKAYKDKFPEVSDQAAVTYAEQAYRDAMSQRQKQEADLQQVQKSQKEEAISREIDNFQKQFPDVDIENMPADVIEDIQGGSTLTSAWIAHENRELKATLAAERKNSVNRSKAVGSVNANAGSTSGDDELSFLINGFANDD